MSFTQIYSTDSDDREGQKRYEAHVEEAYDDWLANKEIHLIEKPTMGLDYKEMTKPMIKQFLSSHPQYLKITFTVNWKKTNLKRTQVWSQKKRVDGRFILCLYKVNCTIMKVQDYQKPKFLLSKPKNGKTGRVIVMPMTGGKSNRKTIMGVIDVERIQEEDEYTEESDQEVIAKYFLEIVEDLWKDYHWKPTIDFEVIRKKLQAIFRL